MCLNGLSVVLPLYNGAAYVQRAIESVASQVNLPADWEIIVVDDGSQDDGARICQQLTLQIPQIHLISQPTNLGVAAARNRGVSSARYGFLSFIDQDDQWVTDKWDLQYQALIQSGADYVFGHQAFNVSDPTRLPIWLRSEWLATPQKGYVFGALLIRKADFLRVGLLREDLLFGTDDVDWFARAKELALTEHMLDDVVLQRHVHDRNASARTEPFSLELLKVIRQRLSRGNTVGQSQRTASVKRTPSTSSGGESNCMREAN